MFFLLLLIEYKEFPSLQISMTFIEIRIFFLFVLAGIKQFFKKKDKKD